MDKLLDLTKANDLAPFKVNFGFDGAQPASGSFSSLGSNTTVIQPMRSDISVEPFVRKM
jgi:hypothetical protein